MLTDLEQAALAKLGEAANAVFAVIKDGGDPSAAKYDALEAAGHIHALQQAVMSNEAARAHPEQYRVLGARLVPRAEEADV